MLEANGRINPGRGHSIQDVDGAIYDENDIALMLDILNLALRYFGPIFFGFACGKAKGLPEQGLAWMNFFLLYVSLPALLFGIMMGFIQTGRLVFP